ncbi:MAG: diguanylate cyclase [Gammaproteobacteria bacterium]|nr:diguanylate cyclase [Gammaproteobacteria bacterium]
MGIENPTPSEAGIEDSEVGSFIVYADFNCPFCHALNERLHALGLDDRVDFRVVDHAPRASSRRTGFEVLSELTAEIAEVRSRAPSTAINVPVFRPASAAASKLYAAVNRRHPDKAAELRRRIFRALWIDGADISDAALLDALVEQLGVQVAVEGDLDDELMAWQRCWNENDGFDRQLPILINGRGETVVGFPLEPELDAFLQSGSLIAGDGWRVASEITDMPRILVLDSDEASVRMIVEQMRNTQVEIVPDFSTLSATAVQQDMPDLVIVDTDLLGDVDSTDWWRDSTDSDLDIAVPVIFVSDDPSTQAEVSAFDAGAADFIAKPFHPRVLQARLNMHLKARRSQIQLNNIARIDALTSICNRREFDLRLMSEWGRSARAGKSLALLMIDVDHFKEYNDQHGHLQGDDCLVSVARILSDCMQRSGDLVARYGGEEFVALLPETDTEGAIAVAEYCRSSVEEAAIAHVSSNVAPVVTVSIGVAAMMPLYDKSSTLLLEQADISLYQAKQTGRNKICSFND